MQGEKDVILPAGDLASFVVSHGGRVAILRLRDVVRGILQNEFAGAFDFLPAGLPSVSAQENFFAVQRPDGELLQILQHHFALINVAQPVGGQSAQHGLLAQVVADDRIGQRQQRAVVRQL